MNPTTYRVGDPDPTPSFGDWPDEECPANNGPYLCTWPVGHDGSHVAGTGEKIVAVWE